MKHKVLLLTLVLGTSTCLLTGQNASPPTDGSRPPGGESGPGDSLRQRAGNPIVAALDLNDDGTIDADELAKAGQSLLKLDKNGDGKLTPDEYRPRRPRGPGGPGAPGGPALQGGPPGPGGTDRQRPADRIITALDLNHDRTIDADELAKASQSLKKLDKNGDGKLTPDEYRPRRPGDPEGPGDPTRQGASGDKARPQGPPAEK